MISTQLTLLNESNFATPAELMKRFNYMPLKGPCRCGPSPLFKFARILGERQEITYVKLQSLSAARKIKTSRQVDIEAACTQLTQQDISTYDFIKKLSFKFLPALLWFLSVVYNILTWFYWRKRNGNLAHTDVFLAQKTTVWRKWWFSAHTCWKLTQNMLSKLCFKGKGLSKSWNTFLTKHLINNFIISLCSFSCFKILQKH